jgi:hypothetical protein
MLPQGVFPESYGKLSVNLTFPECRLSGKIHCLPSAGSRGRVFSFPESILSGKSVFGFPRAYSRELPKHVNKKYLQPRCEKIPHSPLSCVRATALHTPPRRCHSGRPAAAGLLNVPAGHLTVPAAGLLTILAVAAAQLTNLGKNQAKYI